MNKYPNHENEKPSRAEKLILKHQQALRAITAELSLAEERERRRIAMDIHDSIGQTLAIIKMKLTTLKSSIKSAEIVKHLDEILEYNEQTINETRSLSQELSSPILYTLGLEAALENLVEKFQEKHNLSIEFKNDNQAKKLSLPSQIHLFRSIRELMFNIIRHSHAQHVKVNILRENNIVKIIIEDDGIGFDSSKITFQPNAGGGFGLFSVRERLIYLGGHFEIDSRPGRGTVIMLSAPLSFDTKGNFKIE